MGRTKKYATDEEAREAKKAQMKAAYERRKKARMSSPETPPPKEPVKKEAPNTIQESIALIADDIPPKPRKLKISEKAQLWDELEKMITSATR